MNFDFKEDYILENEAVRLEPLKISDYDILIHYSENEPEIWEYNAGGANGKENLKNIFLMPFYNENRKKNTHLLFWTKSLTTMLEALVFTVYF